MLLVDAQRNQLLDRSASHECRSDFDDQHNHYNCTIRDARPFKRGSGGLPRSSPCSALCFT